MRQCALNITQPDGFLRKALLRRSKVWVALDMIMQADYIEGVALQNVRAQLWFNRAFTN